MLSTKKDIILFWLVTEYFCFVCPYQIGLKRREIMNVFKKVTIYDILISHIETLIISPCLVCNVVVICIIFLHHTMYSSVPLRLCLKLLLLLSRRRWRPTMNEWVYSGLLMCLDEIKSILKGSSKKSIYTKNNLRQVYIYIRRTSVKLSNLKIMNKFILIFQMLWDIGGIAMRPENYMVENPPTFFVCCCSTWITNTWNEKICHDPSNICTY